MDQFLKMKASFSDSSSRRACIISLLGDKISTGTLIIAVLYVLMVKMEKFSPGFLICDSVLGSQKHFKDTPGLYPMQ